MALAGLAVSGCNEGYGSSAQDASSANLSAQTTMVTTTNPMLSGQASTVTTGTLYYHAYVPQTNTSVFLDNLVLDGDKYTDLIMSNYIAGVMLGHNIKLLFPGMQFNKDYVYGSILGQLLQENIETQLYIESGPLIDPSPSQASVMGQGQGGPYQINSYYQDMAGGGYSATGFSLVNYVALKTSIGYTIPEQASKFESPTPPSFNNKYFGPMVTSYFHLNDMAALAEIESGAYISTAAPNYPACIINLKSIANNPLDIVYNYAYNQGYYGGLVNTITTDCIKDTASDFLTKYNDFATAGPATGNVNTYEQYPYQVRFYLDQIYDQSPLGQNIHIAFNMTELGNVFSNVFQTLGYLNAESAIESIPTAQAIAAYNQALTTNNVSNTAILDLSDATQRQVIYAVLEDAINNLSSNLNINFIAKTLVEGNESAVVPICPTNPIIFPANQSSYTGGTIVQGTDGKLYQCKSDQVATWCQAGGNYAPTTGWAWSQAWKTYDCTTQSS